MNEIIERESEYQITFCDIYYHRLIIVFCGATLKYKYHHMGN